MQTPGDTNRAIEPGSFEHLQQRRAQALSEVTRLPLFVCQWIVAFSRLSNKKVSDFAEHPGQIRFVGLFGKTDHGRTTTFESLLQSYKESHPCAPGSSEETTFGLEHIYTRDPMHLSTYLHTLPDTCTAPRDAIDNQFLIHVFRTPTVFDSFVNATLLMDGALLVFDCMEGISTNLIDIVRDLLNCQTQPVAFANKLDTLIVNLGLPSEEIYMCLAREINNLNEFGQLYSNKNFNLHFSPVLGTVAFGCASGCWAFTLSHFAKLYAKKFGIKEAVMTEKLWGDNFFDISTKKWVSAPGKTHSVRGFSHFVMDPLLKLWQAVQANQKPAYEKMTSILGINLSPEEKEITAPNKLFDCIMKKFLPFCDTLLSLFAIHLPSPKTAQTYRLPSALTPIDAPAPSMSSCAREMLSCSPQGPVTLYTFRKVDTAKESLVCARVFSGTLRGKSAGRILSAPSINDIKIPFGNSLVSVPECPSGNIVVISIPLTVKNISIPCLTASTVSCLPFQLPSSSTFFSSARVNVRAIDSRYSVQLDHAIRRTVNGDAISKYEKNRDGSYTIFGQGALHLEVLLKDLKEEYSPYELVVSQTQYPLAEGLRECSPTVRQDYPPGTEEPLLSMSATKIPEPIVNSISAFASAGTTIPIAVNNSDLLSFTGGKPWAYGESPLTATCILVDLNDTSPVLKAPFAQAFHTLVTGGPLRGNPLRGVQFSILKCSARCLATSPAVLINSAMECMRLCLLSSSLSVWEQTRQVSLKTLPSEVATVYSVLQAYQCIDANQEDKGEFIVITGKIPARLCQEFPASLRAKTAGKVFIEIAHTTTWSETLGMP
ncbi:elongation factor 2 [Pelomyxa schiedti]|nr:elongation factor 2 [Pelomyxa schiedti]